ncbi:unnamed protein product [Clonostachys chloroleuca]|uniref:Mandelate racemase n=1 Tax=Clonostachys chloroleuca TaxID=1926264 RepID=A0AA35Q8I2_9HYPO|nr:unnamed protein product [Clonostachys chloroleuca]
MEELKIARIDVFQVDLPYRGGVYRLSGGREYKSFDATIVRITTQNEIASHALGVRAGIAEIAPKLIGLDPRRVDRVYDAMDAALVGHSHAKAAIDVACWDIFGKATGLPMPIIDSCPVTGPAETRQQVEAFCAEGYTGHSLKVGDDPTIDAERITAALADKKPGEFFIVDANGGMNLESALRMLRQLPPDLDFTLALRGEKPFLSNAELTYRYSSMSWPLAMNQSFKSSPDDAADGIGLKISKNGGLTKGRRQRDICVAAGLTVSVQEKARSEIALSAIVDLGQTIPERNQRTILDTRGVVSLTTADVDFEVVDGRISAPNTPGLGVRPRLDVLGDPVASYH